MRKSLDAAILLFTASVFTACGGGGGSSSVVIPPTTVTVALHMTQAWTDTAMMVKAGQQLNISASGSMRWLGDGPCILASGACTSTPGGLPWSNCVSEPPPAFTAPGLACWSMIGKIGTSGTSFEVGNTLQLVAAQGGELYLGINDNYFPDDTGNWTATLTPM